MITFSVGRVRGRWMLHLWDSESDITTLLRYPWWPYLCTYCTRVCVCSVGERVSRAAYWWDPSTHPSNYLLSFFLLHLSFSQSSLLPLLYPCLSLCRINSRCFWLATVFILEDLGALSIGYIKVFLSIETDLYVCSFLLGFPAVYIDSLYILHFLRKLEIIWTCI